MGGNDLLRAAADAIGRIGDDDAIEALANPLKGFRAAVEAEGTMDTQIYWRYDAIVRALQHTRSRRAIQGLLSMGEVNIPQLSGRIDLGISLQQHALEALANIRNSATLPVVSSAALSRDSKHAEKEWKGVQERKHRRTHVWFPAVRMEYDTVESVISGGMVPIPIRLGELLPNIVAERAAPGKSMHAWASIMLYLMIEPAPNKIIRAIEMSATSPVGTCHATGDPAERQVR